MNRAAYLFEKGAQLKADVAFLNSKELRPGIDIEQARDRVLRQLPKYIENVELYVGAVEAACI